MIDGPPFRLVLYLVEDGSYTILSALLDDWVSSVSWIDARVSFSQDHLVPLQDRGHRSSSVHTLIKDCVLYKMTNVGVAV